MTINSKYRIDQRVVTPYGTAVVIGVNPCYGVKVRFCQSGIPTWFRFWEVREEVR